jgi:hypothetical protein
MSLEHAEQPPKDYKTFLPNTSHIMLTAVCNIFISAGLNYNFSYKNNLFYYRISKINRQNACPDYKLNRKINDYCSDRQ